METKENLPKEYFSRPGKILKSELNSYSMIMGINQWAVPAIIYRFGIINLTKTELSDIDRKTRTLKSIKSVQSALSDLLTTSVMHGTFSHPSTKRGLILIGLELNTNARELFEHC